MQKVSQHQQEIIKSDVAQSADHISKVLKKIADDKWIDLGTVENTVKRLKRKGHRDKAEQYIQFEETSAQRGILEKMGPEVVSRDVPAESEVINQIVKEGIVGSNDMIQSNFLHKGSRVARSVGRISNRIRREPLGTGFLVSTHLIMTNNHVIPTMEVANECIIEFDFVSDNTGNFIKANEFELRPDIFFLTSHETEFDFTLVAVEKKNSMGVGLEQFGWIKLIEETGKAHIGERLNIIHHPQGKPQHISIRKNLLVTHEQSPVYLKYMTDTQPGSSGSPVLNDDWELVALHRATELINSDEQRELYFQAMYQLDKSIAFELKNKDVSINFGVRISTISNHIKTQKSKHSLANQKLIDEIFSMADPDSLSYLPSSIIANQNYEVNNRQGIDDENRPINISINIGNKAHGEATTNTPPSSISTPPVEQQLRTQLEIYNNQLNSQKSVFKALNFLELARAKQYLQPNAVAGAIISSYYKDVLNAENANEITNAKRYDMLHDLLSSTMTLVNTFPDTALHLESLFQSSNLESIVLEGGISYARARAHLYTWVDLQEDRMLRCVYTQALIAPEQLLLKDLIQALRLDVELPRRFNNNQFLNCEHIVPQSLFNKDALGVSDLHHLITAEGATNTFRSNHPYRQFEDGQGEEGPASLVHYINAGGKNQGEFFEPYNNKGLVARATLYFIVMHKNKLSKSDYDLAAIKTLRKWSNDEPPTNYEKHRNETTFEVQKNRNPFIDFPHWVDEVDFMRGVT